jgi:hypothetical protein
VNTTGCCYNTLSKIRRLVNEYAGPTRVIDLTHVCCWRIDFGLSCWLETVVGVDGERPIKFNMKFNQAPVKMEDNLLLKHLLCVPRVSVWYI